MVEGGGLNDNLWLIELESALLEDNCSVAEVAACLKGREIPSANRPEVWQVCLDVRNKADQLATFDEIFDLPFQKTLRADVGEIVEKLGNEEEDKVSVIFDLESILTFYCKSRGVVYESNNGWIEVLLPLLSLKLRRGETYNMFEAIQNAYVPKGCVQNGNVFHVLRLLVQYHDPELCSVLDTKRITPDMYATTWFRSLFAGTCTLPVALGIWDIYFLQTDPYLIFFLCLIMLINSREAIIGKREEEKDAVVEYLSNMPAALEPEDVMDFCSLAQYYAIKTPGSFKIELDKVLFGLEADGAEVTRISQALCLPVAVEELIEVSTTERPHPDSYRFFLVDCRPAEQYNSGHLATAFHLDSTLMLQEPLAFQTAVQGLLRAQRQAIEANSTAGGEHLCFMGSGRLEEDQYTHMVVASFLQKATRHISLLTGGFAAIHKYFGRQAGEYLRDHHVLSCLVCVKDKLYNNNNAAAAASAAAGTAVTMRRSPSSPNNNRAGTSDGAAVKRQSLDLFSKLSLTMRAKSAEVKDKLLDIIANTPTTPTTPSFEEGERPSPTRRNIKLPRGTSSVFSIDDDLDEADFSSAPEEGEPPVEIVSLQPFIRSSGVQKTFKCMEIHISGRAYDSYLGFTQTHMIILREVDSDGHVRVMSKRPLTSIVKITAKKRHPDLITFKYGAPEGDIVVITDMDRFLIPNASEATAQISKMILKQF